MPQAYSKRFCMTIDAGSNIFTVPAGKVAVVKWVASYNSSGAAGTVNLSVAGRTVWTRSIPGATSADNANMMAVANAGELVDLGNSAVGMRSMACGFLLSAE